VLSTFSSLCHIFLNLYVPNVFLRLQCLIILLTVVVWTCIHLCSVNGIVCCCQFVVIHEYFCCSECCLEDILTAVVMLV
jgi:hypothetical protein